MLTQRLPAETFTAEVALALADDALPGARAGLGVLGDAYAWLGLERGADGAVRVVHRFAEAVADRERDAAHPGPAPSGGRVRVRVEVSAGARCRFAYDAGGGWQPSGPVFAAAPWRWVGALLALFAAAPEGPGAAGTAAFTGFRVTPSRRRTCPFPR